MGGDLGEGWHAQVGGGAAAGGGVVHLGELVPGCVQVGLAAFGLAEVAVAFGFFDAYRQVQDDLGEAGSLGRIGTQERAADAGMLVDAGGAVSAAAVAEGDFPAGEVAAEFLPFSIGDRPVFVGGAQGASACDELAVGVDGRLGVDRGIAHRGPDVLVAGYQLADVRRHAIGDRL
jgi:hypothetical protein